MSRDYVEYFGIDYNIMWDVIKNKLPDLQNNIKTILEMGKKPQSAGDTGSGGPNGAFK